ncbi:hypothetical protein N7457_001848 [Penicillium paradoxum]|uniref:uncharacterized protein n=1 Tax=Penicillium paradoxum TaxID=176176 RepID=UPI0025486C4D|nr:uncharacterized protein N7457_001848 [Penicillium paradoxum]KAJ5795249.1 hypothetical protein N7457_001848 [Penicillium paradoxum]
MSPGSPSSPNQRVRSTSPSPGSGVEVSESHVLTRLDAPLPPRHHQSVTSSPTNVQPSASKKRARSPSETLDSAPARETRREKGRKFCGELGHKFEGSIAITTRAEAMQVAYRIHGLPVPEQVTSRVILFGDACIRNRRGAVGIVWKAGGAASKWDGLGVAFHEKTDDTSALELYAVGCGLKFALDNIDSAEYTVSRDDPADTNFFRPKMRRTGSHSHMMKREVFVFTDEETVLRRLNGDVSYHGDGPYGTQIRAICELSVLLAQRDIHVELHLSPGHSHIPGNVAANDMARKAQRELFVLGHNDEPPRDASTSEVETFRETVLIDSAAVTNQPHPAVPSNLPLKLSLLLQPRQLPIYPPQPAPPSRSPPDPSSPFPISPPPPTSQHKAL